MARSVSDLVTLETPLAGTTSSVALCAGDGHCTAALRQITTGSRFLAALADNVAYRLFLDARSHRGPASVSRLPATACSRQYMPAADPANLSLTGLFLDSFFARNAASNDREPAVAPYARRR